jgi:hypothetical protein
VLLPQQPFAGDEEAAVGEERDAVAEAGGRAARDHLDPPFEIDREHLIGTPVGEPEAAVVPAWRLDVGQAVEKDSGLDRRHWNA